MIVKNEQEVLDRCLDSVRELVDEIIIVDTGSTDNTMDIAKQYTDKIYEFAWIDDFSSARNFSFDKSTCDYTMWLDADDIVHEKDKQLLIEIKQQLSKQQDEQLPIDMVVCRYDCGFDINGKVAFYSMRERIFRTANNYKWVGAVHECIALQGNVLYKKDVAISHHNSHKPSGKSTARNIAIYKKELKTKGQLTPRGNYYYARELRDGSKLAQALHYFDLFLKTNQGWVEDNINACLAMGWIYLKHKKHDSAIKYALKSMEYAPIRAEACCLMGYIFMTKNIFNIAIEWFETALSIPIRDSLGFCNVEWANYVPFIELVVCYDKIGQRTKANEYNELAGKIKPQSNEYLYNKEYLANKI